MAAAKDSEWRGRRRSSGHVRHLIHGEFPKTSTRSTRGRAVSLAVPSTENTSETVEDDQGQSWTRNKEIDKNPADAELISVFFLLLHFNSLLHFGKIRSPRNSSHGQQFYAIPSLQHRCL